MRNFASIFKDANIRSRLTQFALAHLGRFESCLFNKKQRHLPT